MNQSCLSFGFIKGTLSIFNPWRGGWPSRMLEGLSYHNQYRKGRGRGNPRGSAPLCRGARDQKVPGVSLPTFSTRESRPGCRSWQSHDLAERPLMGAVGGFAPHIGERRGAQPLAKATAPCAWHRAAKSPPGSWRRGSPLPAPSAPLAQTAPAARPETHPGPDAAGSRAGRSPDRDG